MAKIEPIRVEIEVDLSNVEDKVIERIAKEVAKRIQPAAPVWIDPRWYRAPSTPWWSPTVTTTSTSSALGVPNTVAQDWNNPDDEAYDK